MEDTPQKRGKKPNFTKEEELLISTEVESYFDILNSKHTNNVTNKRKNEVWSHIAQKVSAVGVAVRTQKEIKDKWCNTKKTAKRMFSEHQRESRKTGGGPRPRPVSEAINKVIDLCKDSSAFKGVGGIEAGLFTVEDNGVLVPTESQSDIYESAASDITLACRSPTPPPPPQSVTQDETDHEQGDSPSILLTRDRNSKPTGKKRIQAAQSTSNSCTKKRKITSDDLLEIQHKVFEKELVKQEKEIEKLNLQIELLKKMHHSSSSPASPIVNHLFSSILSNM